MRDVLRATLVFTAMELKRFLRTSQLWTHVLGPFVGLPAVLLIGMIQLLSTPLIVEWLDPPLRVAIDAQAPAALELHSLFEEEHLEVVLTEDARAAFERDEADVALVTWLDGDGLGTRIDETLDPLQTHRNRPPGWAVTSWRWRTTVLARDVDAQEQVSEIIEDAGDHWLSAQLEVYGLDPDRIRRPWAVQSFLRP